MWIKTLNSTIQQILISKTISCGFCWLSFDHFIVASYVWTIIYADFGFQLHLQPWEQSILTQDKKLLHMDRYTTTMYHLE